MSVTTSSISTVICLLLSLPTAYALSHVAFPGKRLAEILMELTLSLPYILLGFALLLIFSSPLGKALKEAGFAVVFSPAGIVFAQMIVNLPFAICMITCNNHQRTKNHFLETSIFYFNDYSIACCVFRLTLLARSCSPGRAAWASSGRRSCWWA